MTDKTGPHIVSSECPNRVNYGSPVWVSECRVLGAKRTSISGGWTYDSIHLPTLRFLREGAVYGPQRTYQMPACVFASAAVPTCPRSSRHAGSGGVSTQAGQSPLKSPIRSSPDPCGV